MKITSVLDVTADRVTDYTGSPYSFLAAAVAVLLWAVTGRWFDYSNTWQLVINTGTTIITFLMVFLIQHTQNRHDKALHLKLDELITVDAKARNDLRGIEKQPEKLEQFDSH